MQFHKAGGKEAYPGEWVLKLVLYAVVCTVCVIPNNKKLFSTNFPVLLKPFFPPRFRQEEATSGRQM